jgi:hypothetical protein
MNSAAMGDVSEKTGPSMSLLTNFTHTSRVSGVETSLASTERERLMFAIMHATMAHAIINNRCIRSYPCHDFH